MNPYREIFRTMNEAGIRYLIVGGLAVNLHGYRRFTAGVGIFFALGKKNFGENNRNIRSNGYGGRVPGGMKELSDEKKIRQLLEEKGMTAYTFLSDKRERIDIDVIAPDSLLFERYDRTRVVVDIDEAIQVPVISVDDLIHMKQKANRAKDIEDAAALLELKGL